MHDIKTPADLRHYVFRHCEAARETLEKFAVQVRASPDYAFQWSGTAFHAAAVLWELGGAEEMFKEMDSPDRDPARKFPTEEEMLTNLKRTVERELVFKARYVANRSTSATTNLLEDHKLEVKGQFAEALGLGGY